MQGTLGGAERYALELAKAMAAREPTRLLSFGPTPRRFRIDELDVRVIGPATHVRGLAQNPVHRNLVGEVLGARIAHVHQQHTMAASATAGLRAMWRLPTFVTDHGGGGWNVSTYMNTDRWYRAHLHVSNFSRTMAGHADNVVSRVIYGGVDPLRFPYAPVGGSASRALFVGRVLPHKGVDWLIESLPQTMGLDVVGPVDAQYLTFLRSLTDGKDVVFHGPVDDAVLADMYRASAVVVLPSVHRTRDGKTVRLPELLGQTLLEAMSVGRATICSDAGALPEVVTHGETGFVVPERDTDQLSARLQQLHENARLRETLGRRGHERARAHFSWDVVVDRCLDAYRSL